MNKMKYLNYQNFFTFLVEMCRKILKVVRSDTSEKNCGALI